MHCLTEYVVDFAATEGSSMSPTIPDTGSVLVIDKITPRLLGYRKGDVIVSKSPRGAYMVCKRIAATAGDSVPIGKRSVTIAAGHVWLLGDNKRNSVDSNEYGAVPLGLLSGRVRFSLFPIPSLIR
jgi:inner membrane protease subunit 1